MDSPYGVNSLTGQTVYLPGGKDKNGHPLIIIAPSNETIVNVATELEYLLSIFSGETRRRGITVLIDARKVPWKSAKTYIRQVNTSFLSEELARVVCIRPDSFRDKPRVENCANYRKDKEVVFTTRSRSSRFVDQSQLPLELGGSFIYNHNQWIENRLKAEEFFRKVSAAIKDLEEFHQHILSCRLLRSQEVDAAFNSKSEIGSKIRSISERTQQSGQDLLLKIEHDNRNRKFASESESMQTPQDVLDTIESIENAIVRIKEKQGEIDQVWKVMDRNLVDTKDLGSLEQGIVNVTNWILGPAETLLNSQQKVGFDVASAEELRNQHESIELQCLDTYGTYAKLLYEIENFSQEDISSNQRKDLIWQKDFMDFVCRSFATRLERRRNVLITSLRFFRVVAEYFDKTSEVFESLVMGNKVGDFSTARQKLRKLQESQQVLDGVERELGKEGEKLSDMLSMPVKDALGREITIDYSEDIINIRDILDATKARKNLFSDSVELQKLTLEQVTHIDAYEKDAAQAIAWLDELFQVLLQNHGHVGITVQEIQAQKDEHQAFQETAKDTYNYGCQLLNASLLLRQSCKLTILEHTSLNQKLQYSWQRFLGVSQEQMTRLRVSAVFHRSVEDQCNQLRDLRESVATMPLEDAVKKRIKVRNFYTVREKLLVEVGRMVRLGRLLRSRLRESLYLNETLSDGASSGDTEKNSDIIDPSVEDNQIAIEAISEKLTEVTCLAEELDQTLRSAQQDCGLLTDSSSSTSTSCSTTPTTVISMSSKKIRKQRLSTKEESKPEVELRSDEEFLTASDSTLQHSRSSSYNTASECEHRFSPWWEYDDKKQKDNIIKEKMVLGVGLPDLPDPKTVLKPTPEIPPGKIVREVTETTHLKVQHSHTMGVASFVLTSETAREKDEQEAGKVDEEDLTKKMKEVSRGLDEEAWKNYQYVTKQAIKRCL